MVSDRHDVTQVQGRRQPFASVSTARLIPAATAAQSGR